MSPDIIIQGAGVAGATLAYGLGRLGLKVMVVERSDGRRQTNGADLLKPSGIQVMAGLGLLEKVFAAGGRRRSEVRIFHNRQLLASLDYTKIDLGLGYFVLISYGSLRQLLMEALAELPNVQLHFQTTIKCLEIGPAGPQIILSTGERLAPSVVIGADGSESWIRAQLGLIAERTSYTQQMYLGSLPIVQSAEECNRLYVDSQQGLAYLYPIGHDRTRLVLGFPPDEARRLLRDKSGHSLVARLATFVGESDDALAELDGSILFHAIPISKMHLPAYAKNNVVLVGNAAHSVHPITGQGMNLAIEDAGALTRHLRHHFEGGTTLSGALQSFQEERHPINEAVVAYGHRLATTFHDQSAFASSMNLNLQSSSRDPRHLAEPAASLASLH